jgi:hypothetical protein
VRKEFQRGNILMQPIIINQRGRDRDHSEINLKDPDLKIDTDQGPERGERHTREIADDQTQGITKRVINKRKEDLPENQVLMKEDQVFIIRQVIIVIRLKKKQVQWKSNLGVAQRTKAIIQKNHLLHPHLLWVKKRRSLKFPSLIESLKEVSYLLLMQKLEEEEEAVIKVLDLMLFIEFTVWYN